MWEQNVGENIWTCDEWNIRGTKKNCIGWFINVLPKWGLGL